MALSLMMAALARIWNLLKVSRFFVMASEKIHDAMIRLYVCRNLTMRF